MSADPATVAPFERPVARRGVRGRLAAVVAAAAVPVLFASRVPMWGSGGGSGGGGGWTYSYRYGQPSLGTGFGLAGMALLLLVAAGVLWRAHARWLVAVGALAAMAAAAGAVEIVAAANRAGKASAAAINALGVGTPRSVVADRLGSPQSTTEAFPAGPGRALDCLVYAVANGAAPAPSFDPRGSPPPAEPGGHIVLCFSGGRLVLRSPG